MDARDRRSRRTPTTARDDGSTLLRCALLANALFSAASGIGLLLLADHIAGWMAISSPGLLRIVGGLLIPFAAELVAQSRRREVARGRAVAAIAADLAWVAGSAVLVGFFPGSLSPGGRSAVVVVAVVVLLFALLQIAGLRRVG